MAVKPGWEGRFFEDFEVGDIYRCRLGRTVTENDNIWFTLLTNNTNQIHFNAHYASLTEFPDAFAGFTMFTTPLGPLPRRLRFEDPGLRRRPVRLTSPASSADVAGQFG